MHSYATLDEETRFSVSEPEGGRRPLLRRFMTRAANIASQDTPQAVTVPASLSGLMTYAVAKLGMGALFAWGCWFLADSREQLHVRYETQLQSQVVQQQAQITAMEAMIRTMSAAMEMASKKAPK